MRNILCILRDASPNMVEEICRFGHDHGWLIDFYGMRFDLDWMGDGVLVDYCSMKELEQLPNFRHLPIVSRELLPHGNIRTVTGGAQGVAELVFKHFKSRGFNRIASVDIRDWTPGKRSDQIVGNDPIESLHRITEKSGDELLICYWQPNLLPQAKSSYTRALSTLRNFFAGIPRPFGLFIPTGDYLTICYRVLIELGLRVPEDVAIICNSGNKTLLNSMPVSITGVSSESRVCGRKMAELLEKMMNGEEVPEGYVEIASPGTIIPGKSTDVLAVSDPSLAGAITFVLNHCNESISIEDMAFAAGVSSQVLARLFKKYLNITPVHFLQNVRMSRIRSQLVETKQSLSEIAACSGYGSAMALSLAFKRHNGMTPGKYRQIYRNMPPESEQ